MQFVWRLMESYRVGLWNRGSIIDNGKLEHFPAGHRHLPIKNAFGIISTKWIILFCCSFLNNEAFIVSKEKTSFHEYFISFNINFLL